MSNLFNKDYYENGIQKGISCYENYRWIPELTIPFAFRIIEYLNIKSDETILDYGCAKGFLVKAFRLLYREAYGYDISVYAVQHAPEDVQKFVSNSLDDLSCHKYDIVVCKDVLEHIPYEMLSTTLKEICKLGVRHFFVIPLGDGKKYHIPSYELDKTHRLRQSLQWWEEILRINGFHIVCSTNRIPGMKENYAEWQNGNGFIYCRG